MSTEEQSFEDVFNELVDGPEEALDSSPQEYADDNVDDMVDEAALTTDEGESDGETLQGQEADQEVATQPRDEQGRFTSAPAEPVQDEIEQYKAEIQKWQHKYNSDLGRQNALQRKITELEAQVAEARKAPNENPEGSGVTDAEWESMKEDFPEIASGFDARLRSVTAQYEQQIQQLQAAINPIQEQARSSQRNMQLEQLAQQHPDWQDIAGSQEFRSWVNEQPRPVQQLIESEDAAEAAYLISTYKQSTGQVTQAPNDELKQRRDRQLRQGQTISNRGGRSKTNLPPADDYEAAFNYFAERG